MKTTAAENYAEAEALLFRTTIPDTDDCLRAIAHGILAVAGRPLELEPFRELRRRYESRQTDTRFGGAGSLHASGYALAMKHAADLLGQLLDDLGAV